MSQIQFGRVLACADSERNLYDLCLIDSGQLVRAMVSMPAKGQATRFQALDTVVAMYCGGAWVINGYVPGFVEKSVTAPRNAALSPGDQFIGNAETSSGMHVTGGTVSMEAGGVDADGKLRSAARTYWVPDSDAIRNLARRFDIDAATGQMQCLHDDITGQTAFRIWARQGAITGMDGKLARIHMGYHKSPIGATFSITTFPPGPDPTDGKMEPNFTLNAAQQTIPFAGQWPKLERDDWQTRFYVMPDGTAIYENAMVPAPSMTPTTEAMAKVRCIITPEGFITTTADQLVTLNAMNQLIALKNTYIMTAQSAALTLKQFFNVNAETITLFTKGTPASVILGEIGDSLPLCNQIFRDFINAIVLENLENHVHTGVQPGSGVSGPQAGGVRRADDTMITKATHAS